MYITVRLKFAYSDFTKSSSKIHISQYNIKIYPKHTNMRSPTKGYSKAIMG